MSGFDDQNDSYSDLEISPLSSKTVSRTPTKQDYKHVSFINVLPDLEDFEYQRLCNNNREVTGFNPVLHQPPVRCARNESHSILNCTKNGAARTAETSNCNLPEPHNLTLLVNKPNEFNKTVEQHVNLSNQNTNFNAGRRSSNQTLAKFSNLREVEDVKGAESGDSNAKNTSRIGTISNGKNISEMSLEEIQELEDQLSKGRKITKRSSKDYDFNMVQDSSRGLDQSNIKNGSGKGNNFTQKDMDILQQKEKLLLQNGYPTRPWIRNNSCILNYKHSTSVKRTVFVYVSGREHTWTSLEYYFKYIQQDDDHLIIGSWIPRKDVIQPEFEKSSFSEHIRFNHPIDYYKNMENIILSSCHGLLNYAVYKNNLKNSKPIQISCVLQTNDDFYDVFIDIMNEFEPMLNIITSATYNHFIKFHNDTIKLSNFFTKFLASCVVINQEFFDMPVHMNTERANNCVTAKQSTDIIDKVIEETVLFPFENCTSDDMKSLHSYIPTTQNDVFRKYHYHFPKVPLKIDAQMKVTTPEGFFIRNGYFQPVIKQLQFDDYNPETEDVSVNRFYVYINKRRSLDSVKSAYTLAMARFKPSFFYIDQITKSNSNPQTFQQEHKKKLSEFENSATMLMLKKVVSSNSNSGYYSGGTNVDSRRGSAHSIDENLFGRSNSNDTRLQHQETYENYYNQDYYLEKDKEEKKKLKLKQDKLKKEMEQEMNENKVTLVKQSHDALQKFREEKKMLNKVKSQAAEGSVNNISLSKNTSRTVEKNADAEKPKKKSWRFW